MNEKDVITLDNGINYLIVDKYELLEGEFYLAVGIDKDEELDPDNIQILYLGEDEEGEFIEIVEDEKIIKDVYSQILIEVAADENPDIEEELIKEIEKKLNEEEGSN